MNGRRDSALRAARDELAGAYCAALAAAALIVESPLLLGVLLVVSLAVAAAAHAGRPVRRALRLSLPLAVFVVVVNGLVVREGLTVIARLGELGPLGQIDITLEALVYGAVFGLRVALVMAAVAIAGATIDADELLRLFRRWSFRSALSVAIATRMVPVLTADARRFGEAQRCRPDPPRGARARIGFVSAVATGALDRAVDVAAALEVRGFGARRRRPARSRRPFSRHDLAFAVAGAALLALAVVTSAAGLAPFSAYPQLHIGAGAGTFAVAAGLVAIALAPFGQRRGIER